MDFQQYYDTRKKLVNNFLEKRMEKRGISNVDDAMKYSLLGAALPTTRFLGRPWRCWPGTVCLPWLLK